MKIQKSASVLTAGATLLSACCTLLSAIPAAAAETGGLLYDVRNGKITVTGFTEDLPAELVIPAEIDGIRVTSIRDSAFKACTALTSVELPASITDIGSDAFNGCTELTAVTLNEGLQYIWPQAFLGCTALTAVNLPAGLSTLGNSAFSECAALADVTADGNITAIGKDVFYETPWLTAQQEAEQLICLGGNVIDGTACIGEVTVPDDIIAIADSAFLENEELTAVSLPASLTTINYGAFMNCPALADVTFSPETAALTIKVNAFNGCESITAISFPAGVKTIANGALGGCSALQTVSIANPDCICPAFLPDPIPEGLVIHGFANSSAQAIATQNGITFVELGNAHVVGDLNGDRLLDLRDAVLLSRYTAEDNGTRNLISAFADFDEADFNSDGTLNVLDVMILLNMIAAEAKAE